MMSKLRIVFAALLVGALAACHSGVKLDENANKGGAVATQPNPNAVAQVNGRGVLAAVSTDGRTRQVLSVQGGSVREPSWGPFMQ